MFASSLVYLAALLTLSAAGRGLQHATKDGEIDYLEHTHAECVVARSTDLRDTCAVVRAGGDAQDIWATLSNITRDCQTPAPDPGLYRAFGLLWTTPIQQHFQDFLSRFHAATGLDVGFKTRNLVDYASNWLEVWPSDADPGPNDFWMLGAEVFGETVETNVFVDLRGVLSDDDGYQVTDIPAAFRDAGSSVYAGSYSVLPLWLTTYQLMYRRDIFESYHIAVPSTWDEALAVAEQYGKGRLGPGQPDLAFCFEASTACGVAHTALMYILGTIVQVNGPKHGTWFDPDNLQPLYTRPEAMREALRIFMALKQHSVPDGTPCYEMYDMLAGGRCLMLWGFSFAFKRASHNSSATWGRQGVAMTPGSPRVLDRRTGSLVPCSTETCPYGVDAVDARTGAATRVNRVVSIDTASFAINARAPLHRQAAAYAALRGFTGPQEHMGMVLDPTTEVTPMRYFELEQSVWVAAGYHPRDVGEFLLAFKQSFDQDNVCNELRIPGAHQFYIIVQALLEQALYANDTLYELLALAANATNNVIQAYGGDERLLRLYRLSVDYVAEPPPPPQTSSSSERPLTSELLQALVPSLASLVLAACTLWAVLRWRRQRRERRAKLDAAPGVGPNTTLLVTDIQDSTCLWESLPAEAMDAAVKLHHRVVRELLIRHRGFESATEGDSFILAFHHPDRALAFALAAQEALLLAHWPPEVLDSPYAATLYVRHDPVAAAPYVACLTSAALREALTSPPATAKVVVVGGGGAPGSGLRISSPNGRRNIKSKPPARQDLIRSAQRDPRLSLDLVATSPPGRPPPSPVASLTAPPPLLAPHQLPTARSGSLPFMLLSRGDAVRDVVHTPSILESARSALELSRTAASITAAAAADANTATTMGFAVPSAPGTDPPSRPASAGGGCGVNPDGGVNSGDDACADDRSGGGGCGLLATSRRGRLVVTFRSSKRLPGVAAVPSARLLQSYDDAASSVRLSGGGGGGGGGGACRFGPCRNTVSGATAEAPVSARPVTAPVLPPASMDYGDGEHSVGGDEPESGSVAGVSVGSFGGGGGGCGCRDIVAAAAALTLREVLQVAFPGVPPLDREPPPASTLKAPALAASLGTMVASSVPQRSVPPSACSPTVSAQGGGGGGGGGGVSAGADGALIFRGLRVRMGLHCGLYGAAEVQYNHASGRITYPGRMQQLAKAVADAGRGGHITISTRVLRVLSPSGGGGAVHSRWSYLLLGGGCHVLKEGSKAEELHCVFARGLLARAGHLGAVRTLEVKIPGVLDAPLGRVVVAVAQVQDPDSFAGWGLECAVDCHRVLMRCAGSLACRHRGYLVSTPPGSIQAAFTCPVAAVTWLLELQDDIGPAGEQQGSQQRENSVGRDSRATRRGRAPERKHGRKDRKGGDEREEKGKEGKGMLRWGKKDRSSGRDERGLGKGVTDAKPEESRLTALRSSPAIDESRNECRGGEGQDSCGKAPDERSPTKDCTTADCAARRAHTAEDSGSELASELGLSGRVAPAVNAEVAAVMASAGAVALAAPSRSSRTGSSEDTGDAVYKLQRATAVAQLSTLRLKGGVDVGEVAAGLRDGGDMSYNGEAVKRAASLAAHAQWHEVLVGREVARSIGWEEPMAAPAPATLAVRGRNRTRMAALQLPCRTSLDGPPVVHSSRLPWRLTASGASSNHPSSPAASSPAIAVLSLYDSGGGGGGRAAGPQPAEAETGTGTVAATAAAARAVCAQAAHMSSTVAVQRAEQESCLRGRAELEGASSSLRPAPGQVRPHSHSQFEEHKVHPIDELLLRRLHPPQAQGQQQQQQQPQKPLPTILQQQQQRQQQAQQQQQSEHTPSRQRSQQQQLQPPQPFLPIPRFRQGAEPTYVRARPPCHQPSDQPSPHSRDAADAVLAARAQHLELVPEVREVKFKGGVIQARAVRLRGVLRVQ